MNVLQLTDAGLWCAAGDFWIDPWRPVPRAVITHAHADHARTGSGHYLASERSAPLMRHRLGEIALQTVGWGESVHWGRARVSLHPAGHILGSAQVRVEVDGEVWVVSGDYKREPDPTCDAFEVVACDTFITEATFALPIYRWPPTSVILHDLYTWWMQCRARGIPAVVFGYSLGKIQRILAGLAPLTRDPVYLHGSAVALTELYREAGIEMVPTLPVSAAADRTDFAGQLILAPPSAAGTPWMKRFARAETGFASGWMTVRGIRRRKGYDRGFVLSDHADWPELVRTVEETGARRVLATHGNTAVLVRWLRERGIDAAPLQTPFGDGAEES